MDIITADVWIKGMIYTITDERHIVDRIKKDRGFANSYLSTVTGAELVSVEPRPGPSRQCELSGSSTSAENDSDSFQWTTKAVKLLINSYRERISRFRDSKIKKKDLWAEISKVFQEKNMKVSDCRIEKKFQNLKKTFKTIKDNKRNTGCGSVRWEYYEDFNEIFSNDETVNLRRSKITSMELLDNSNSQQSTSNDNDNPIAQQPDVITASGNSTRDRNANYRKDFLQIEKEKVEELRNLSEAVKESNSIQKERNQFIEKNNALLEKLVNNLSKT